MLISTPYGLMPLIHLQPTAPVVERIAYSTDVMSTVTGKENRIQTRTTPRTSYDYKYPVGPESTAMMSNIGYGYIRNKFAIPIWVRKTTSQSLNLSGDTEIHVKAREKDFTVGCALMLYADKERAEAHVINSVGEEIDGVIIITLSTPLVHDWPAFSSVIPVHYGYVEEDIDTYGNGYSSYYTLTFEIDVDVYEDPVVPLQLEGIDVFYDTPLMSDGNTVSRSFSSRINIVDFEIGKKFKRTTWSKNRMLFSFRQVFETLNDLRNFKSRFSRHAGRYRSFYQSTSDRNMRIVDSSSGGFNIIRIASDDYGPALPRRLIAIYKLSDKSTHYYKVINAEPSTNNTTLLLLDRPFNIDISDIFNVSYVSEFRLDTDILEIHHVGNGVSEISVPMLDIG